MLRPFSKDDIYRTNGRELVGASTPGRIYIRTLRQGVEKNASAAMFDIIQIIGKTPEGRDFLADWARKNLTIQELIGK